MCVASRALGMAPRRKATTPTTRSAAASPRRIPKVKTAKDELPVSTTLVAPALRKRAISSHHQCRVREVTIQRSVPQTGRGVWAAGVAGGWFADPEYPQPSEEQGPERHEYERCGAAHTLKEHA